MSDKETCSKCTHKGHPCDLCHFEPVLQITHDTQQVNPCEDCCAEFGSAICVDCDGAAESQNRTQVKREPQLTEAMIDAPRYFFSGLTMGITSLESMRAHLDACGVNYSCWPEWAKTDDGHITKAGRAILVYTMMEHAKEQP